ncbi:hypothetical protein FG386_001056 [Cryptosporidium ryanae]|uniref:uncharacterized protein n=1 Tax=Cryptosporidium ryanae TaxID=515981 RepID=UPI003519EFA1|nr:hypothetical protein FG386_001056 [Cryptosporidium ryanae]
MNVWSLGRFSSASGCNISSGLNHIGYFAYSINLKIIIIDLNSIIDGNNGNLLLRSNTFNRIVIDFQGINTSIRFWKDYKATSAYNNNNNDNIRISIYNKISIKSLYVNEITWGPFINFRWSVLFTLLNNGLICVWLIPITDSFSLSSYSPNPSFDLLELIYKEIINNNNIIEFDLLDMKKVDKKIIDFFYFDLLLNTENPNIQSCSFSTQQICLYLNNMYLYYIAAFWNNFIVIYKFLVYTNNENGDKNSLNKILNLKNQELLDKFPQIPYFDCKPIFITRIPDISDSEIITCCFITDTWKSNINNLYFEIFIGTSNGRILLIQFNINEKEELNCINVVELKRIVPKTPISILNCVKIKKNSENKYIWSASYSANIIFGEINIDNGLTNTDIKNFNNSLEHKFPIKTIKIINDTFFNGKLYHISFFSVDQTGVGILYCFDLDNNMIISFQTLSMNKLSNSQNIFPIFDQNLYFLNDDQSNNSNNLQSNKVSFESLQNVPLSIQNYKNNIEDYTLVSLANSTIPTQFNYIINDIQTYSVALLYSPKSNTIRIILVFNPFSIVDHITKRINTHFYQVNKLISDTINKRHNDYYSLFDNLSKIISCLFTLNDIRLLLCGPLSMHKIPTLDDSNEDNNVEINESKYSDNNNNNNININNPYSFLNFSFGKSLKLKIDNNNNDKFKDENNNDLMTYFTYLFYYNIPDEVIYSAISYLNIDNEFQENAYDYLINSKLVFSNLLLIYICYIVELEPFIPKYMESIIDLKQGYIESTIITLIEFYYSSVDLISDISNNNINENKQKIFIYEYKMIYLIRMINSIRCLILLLYSRSNDKIDDTTVIREEKISIYLKKLLYYISFQINKLSRSDKMIENDDKHYIWDCINNNAPIHINKLNYLYLKKIQETKCYLLSDNDYNLFICSHILNTELKNNQDEIDMDNCIYSLPICPITFLPITTSSEFRHLSCSSCGKITFIHKNLIGDNNIIIDDISESYDLFERYTLKNGYISCQLCLNFVELLEI